MDNYLNTNVRRQDRLLDEERAEEIIKTSDYGVLSMVEERDGRDAGYGIPLNYVWDNDRYIYIHCAPQGHKLECLDRNPEVTFCIVGKSKVIPDKFTAAYESVLIKGVIKRDLPVEERVKALHLILKKYSPDDIEVGIKYAEKSFHRTEVLRFEITSISGKSKKINIRIK